MSFKWIAARVIGIAISAAGLLGALDVEGPEAPGRRVLPATILVYHRFGPVVADSMTIRTSTFSWQLRYLRDHAYSIVPLRALVEHLSAGSPVPPRAVAITVDDGHRSVFTEMWPLLRDAGLPATAFIYPSAISNASYAMTWEQLDTLHRSGLVDVQSHAAWHPNFAREKRRLPPERYHEFVRRQLLGSRRLLTARVGGEVDMIAWPFGLFDAELLDLGRQCGYRAGFSIEGRAVTERDEMMALPRFLVTDADRSDAAFRRLLPAATR
jgi:peptidoglycan/xylan/chitin deacetylase (PgdA/CDA1 family)